MTGPAFVLRIATAADEPAIAALMALAIERLQAGFLSPAQIGASHTVMGLDRQLIADGTYFVVEEGAALVGCGGWSRRGTLYGGDGAVALRDATLLDPTRDPARVRAMYTHPDHARRGIGALVLRACEAAARAAGFAEAELMATMSGVPLYRAAGWRWIAAEPARVGDVEVPLLRMGKRLVNPGDQAGDSASAQS